MLKETSSLQSKNVLSFTFQIQCYDKLSLILFFCRTFVLLSFKQANISLKYITVSVHYLIDIDNDICFFLLFDLRNI